MDSKFIKEEYFYQKVKQTKLAVVYSLPILFNNKNVYAARLFNYILGGSSLTSKLSKSIREKEGLCYSIYSVYNSNYGYLVIFTGISKNNVNHVLSKIQDEITLMAKGKISDIEIDNAKQSFINDIETIDDDIFANLRLYDKYALINENIDKSKLIKYYKKNF